QDHEISQLKTRVKLLEDREGAGITQSGEDAPIKERSLDEWEAAAAERSTERGSDDTKEMVNILTSLDAAKILTSGGVQVSISPAAEFATAIMMIDGLDRNNKTVAKYVQEYHQFAAELPIGRRIELISDLVKYQDNYAKVLKFQTQQRKPLLRKQQRDFYMSVLRSHAGWKAKHFKEMTLEEIKEKFDLIWKQMQDLIPMGSKEEVKETLNIRPAVNDEEKELWVEMKRLYEPDVEDLLWTHT
nr:hypothetical protein [Tanacetum cinerariifolium]